MLRTGRLTPFESLPTPSFCESVTTASTPTTVDRRGTVRTSSVLHHSSSLVALSVTFKPHERLPRVPAQRALLK
jgi:hypothetical protein